MEVTMRSNRKEKLIKSLMQENVPINAAMPDYRLYPYFVKKHRDAGAFLKKVGVPEMTSPANPN
ncbi:hypothetical protein [uncultured Chitinophaga sp.]|uniref:hypothetical protein n=1 Tax=uncultured Chitinophaga sp. TaxID=339340 RepID=UPI0025DF6F07|nr:hypothetical protein [uncultured Chitinophaga sp.]